MFTLFWPYFYYNLVLKWIASGASGKKDENLAFWACKNYRSAAVRGRAPNRLLEAPLVYPFQYCILYTILVHMERSLAWATIVLLLSTLFHKGGTSLSLKRACAKRWPCYTAVILFPLCECQTKMGCVSS